MHRIYHDFNKTCQAIHPGMDCAPLVCRGTHDDLERLSLRLKEGMEVLLYMPDCDENGNFGALEVKATVHHASENGHFVAEYVCDDVEFVPAKRNAENT